MIEREEDREGTAAMATAAPQVTWRRRRSPAAAAADATGAAPFPDAFHALYDAHVAHRVVCSALHYFSLLDRLIQELSSSPNAHLRPRHYREISQEFWPHRRILQQSPHVSLEIIVDTLFCLPVV
jgi:hypothetical protein